MQCNKNEKNDDENRIYDNWKWIYFITISVDGIELLISSMSLRRETEMWIRWLEKKRVKKDEKSTLTRWTRPAANKCIAGIGEVWIDDIVTMSHEEDAEAIKNLIILQSRVPISLYSAVQNLI